MHFSLQGAIRVVGKGREFTLQQNQEPTLASYLLMDWFCAKGTGLFE